MHAWEAIQNSVNYIEDNLTEEIKIDKLADISALSPYYYQRLFKRLVKKPVNEYIRLRRLSKASDALKKKDNRILDVALEFGFSDHANFTRAFRDAYGITPEEYRRNPVILNHFIKPDLLLDYTMVDEDVPLISDGIVVEVTRRKLAESRTFIGIEGEIPCEELSVGKSTGIATAGTIWNNFHNQKQYISNLIPKGNEIGVLYAGNAVKGCCTYLAGAEADVNTVEGYTSFVLPSRDYIVCCFEAENFTELIGTAIFKATSFLNSWTKKHDLSCGNFAAEIYYNTEPDASYMELWLPLSTSPRMAKPVEFWDKTNQIQKPSLDTVISYVNSPLWDNLCRHIEAEYQCKPILEYSGCSMQKGWNMKYKKSGRSLCTLYPMDGFFIALVVISEKERIETELMLPFCTEYLQQLYHDTKVGMGQKWLMINVTDEAVLEDVKHCIAIRRGKKIIGR